MSQDALGDRQKAYEDISRNILTRRMPKILRLDGKAFHSLTKDCEKPFDPFLMSCMNDTALALCREVMGAQIAFIASDEISILINDYKKFGSQTWFDSNIQKMVSVSAAIASVEFTHHWNKNKTEFQPAYFDARIFVLPEREVNNNLYWRQKDWERNSIQMLTRAHYSHKEMANKKIPDMHEMLHAKGVNWNNIPVEQRRGRCAIKTVNGWVIDHEPPIFSTDHYYIEQHLLPEEE